MGDSKKWDNMSPSGLTRWIEIHDMTTRVHVTTSEITTIPGCKEPDIEQVYPDLSMRYDVILFVYHVVGNQCCKCHAR